MLIINGTVHTMEGLTIPGGYVDIQGDKIAGTGPMEECPKSWEGEVFDAQGGHIQPGFVDAHCHLGMFGDSTGIEGDDGNEATDPCTPHLRAVDAVNPMDRGFQEAREAGVTTVLTGPGSANPISGQFAALKTNGRWVDAMVLKAPAAMKLALGENPKLTYHERHETPTTRMATAAIIRENLAKAVEYREKLERAAQDEEEDKPDYDAKLEALLPVIRGELPVHIHAQQGSFVRVQGQQGNLTLEQEEQPAAESHTQDGGQDLFPGDACQAAHGPEVDGSQLLIGVSGIFENLTNGRGLQGLYSVGKYIFHSKRSFHDKLIKAFSLFCSIVLSYHKFRKRKSV